MFFYLVLYIKSKVPICTYDTMCPMGIRTLPSVLSTVQDEYQRSLIVDFEGIWVYLGGKKMCIRKLWNATCYDTGGEDVTQTLNNIESMSKD